MMESVKRTPRGGSISKWNILDSIISAYISDDAGLYLVLKSKLPI